MSEQTMPDATYVVTRNFNQYRIAQRDERGIYRTCVQMEGPFNNHEAALELCDQMNTIDAPLSQTPISDKSGT